MTEIGFYHLTRSGLEQVLPQLLQKTLAAGKRALVVLGSDDRVRDMDSHLWSFEPASWLPHGTPRDKDPEEQPVWLSTEDTNLNAATFLFLADGAVSEKTDSFERCFDIFDGHNEDAVAAARASWKTLKDANHTLTYWQQSDRGWEQKA